MKIFVTGGTGFVGTHLSRRLLALGHTVIATGTRPEQTAVDHDDFYYISADTTREGLWQDTLGEVDAAVNLAGRSIFSYWTEGYKQEMYDSRIRTTRHLVDALPEDRPVVLVSTSAVGYYGSRGDTVLTENSPPGDDFLARLGRDWEAEAMRAGKKGARVVISRFGIVLGPDGGAMKQMLPIFRFGLGGALGSGSQWFPWIHIDDLVAAIVFAIDNEELKGPANYTAPTPVRNRVFVRQLGDVLDRPAFMPAPAFMIRMVMGELGEALLASTRAVPERLKESGFSFTYPEVRPALEHIVAHA